MSSHWAFFPITQDRLEDRFVDVTGLSTSFEADKSSIGKKLDELQPAVKGESAWFDFYNPDEWERLELGVFGPEYDCIITDETRSAYKEHMRIQMKKAKQWRLDVLGEGDTANKQLEDFPPLVACASNAVPTINQVLRRKRPCSGNSARTRLNTYQYDYSNGRSVPGDGRIDFDKAFPPNFVIYKSVTLGTAHAKQMCWEESGGDWAKIYQEVVDQVEHYLESTNVENGKAPNIVKQTAVL